MAEPRQRPGLVGWIDRLLLLIAGTALVLMMLHISLDVVSNLVFGMPVPLTNAVVTQYYMICAAFLPLAATELRNAHISVDLVVDRLPPRARGALEALVQLLGMALYGALAAQAWQLAQEKLARDAFLMEQTTRVSTWPSYFLVPAGFGLVALLLAVRLACRLLGRPQPAAPVLPVEESHV